VEALLQRYELLERIYISSIETRTDVTVEEIYVCGGRQIYVRGKIDFDSLDLTCQQHPVRVNERVVWKGIRSLSESDTLVARAQDEDFVTLVKSAIFDGSSPP
jgi:hypothetical protein